MSTRRLNLGDFAAHCLEEIQTVQGGSSIIEILSSGRVVAVLSPPPPDEKMGALADWMGGGAGLMRYGSNYNPAAPAFAAEEWEAFHEASR